jgi:hypothetical protein
MKRKLEESQVYEIKELYKEGNVTIRQLAIIYNVGKSLIHCIISNKAYGLKPKLTIKERFMRHVIKSDSCWIFPNSTYDSYGQFSYKNGKATSISAHRMSYQLFKGEIPEGLLIRHTCHNKQCVNPEHLQLGTHRDNMMDNYNGDNPRYENGSPRKKLNLRKWHKNRHLA